MLRSTSRHSANVCSLIRIRPFILQHPCIVPSMHQLEFPCHSKPPIKFVLSKIDIMT